ncbi:MAG TPA: glycine zipper 2TM domain-containing protein [Thermoanaerobaculia bacterium]|nr:glycine zipper 2TM domain-containing protein [Thermoanaerobaculia bacterium]
MRFTQKLFPVLLCGTVLLAAGCGRDAEQEEARVVGEEASQSRPADEDKGYVIEEPGLTSEMATGTEIAAEGEPEALEAQEESQEAAELRRETVVDIDQGTRPSPPAAREQSRQTQAAELEARERRLEQRQAELEARERELSRRERPQRPAARPERPAPAEETEVPVEIEETAEVGETSRPVEVEPEVEADPEERAVRELPRTAAASATVPTGTLMEVEVLERLASDTTRAGETFRARIVSDLRSDDGRVAVPAGSEIAGVVDEVVPLRKVGGRAKMALRFTDLVLPSGTTVPIRASLVQEGRSETKKDAATIGGATAGGAILGRILSKRGDRSRATVIGAIIGAAAGTAIASRSPGEEVVIAEGTVVDLSLDQDVEIRPRR